VITIGAAAAAATAGALRPTCAPAVTLLSEVVADDAAVGAVAAAAGVRAAAAATVGALLPTGALAVAVVAAVVAGGATVGAVAAAGTAAANTATGLTGAPAPARAIAGAAAAATCGKAPGHILPGSCRTIQRHTVGRLW